MKKFSFLNYYLKPTGRIGRAEYAIAIIIIPILLFFFSMLVDIIFSFAQNDSVKSISISMIALFNIIFLIVGYMNLMVKRLHDINFSGKWTLIIWLLIAISFVSEKYFGGQGDNIFYIISVGINVVTIMFLLFKKGTEGSNKYDIKMVS